MKHSSTRPSRRTILLAAVWAVLILLNFAGLFWNISRFSEGAIGTAKFYKTLLHFGRFARAAGEIANLFVPAEKKGGIWKKNFA